MGNHTAGYLVVLAAETMAERRKPSETAMEILDAAVAKAKESHSYTPDTEFDDYANPGTTFGDLLIEAFYPNYEANPDPDDDGDQWYEMVYAPFNQRYGMC